jgi:hypothetical protein
MPSVGGIIGLRAVAARMLGAISLNAGGADDAAGRKYPSPQGRLKESLRRPSGLDWCSRATYCGATGSKSIGCFNNVNMPGGSGLSALASNSDTCHISVWLSTWLKAGIPERRIPLATFQ